MVDVALGVVAGLVLFLYGVTRFAEGLRGFAGDGMRTLLARFTRNRFAGLATGAAATTVLDSSSVTIIMVIALVDAQIITFTQSLGVILGSNIGTTVSSQVIALDVARYAPLALIAGFLLHVAARGERAKQTGLLVLGLGLIFFGLGYIETAVEPLRESAGVRAWLMGLEAPLQGALVGALVTVLIQSSSATMGIVIALASSGLMTLPAALAVMLGAEVGTCADTLVASFGRSRAAVRAGLFHLSFNVLTAGLGLALLPELAGLALAVSGAGALPRQVANAHVIFNVLGALIVIGPVPLVARLLERLVPDRARSSTPLQGDGALAYPAP